MESKFQIDNTLPAEAIDAFHISFNKVVHGCISDYELALCGWETLSIDFYRKNVNHSLGCHFHSLVGAIYTTSPEIKKVILWDTHMKVYWHWNTILTRWFIYENIHDLFMLGGFLKTEESRKFKEIYDKYYAVRQTSSLTSTAIQSSVSEIIGEDESISEIELINHICDIHENITELRQWHTNGQEQKLLSYIENWYRKGLITWQNYRDMWYEDSSTIEKWYRYLYLLYINWKIPQKISQYIKDILLAHFKYFLDEKNLLLQKSMQLYDDIPMITHISRVNNKKYFENLHSQTLKNYDDFLCALKEILTTDWKLGFENTPFKNQEAFLSFYCLFYPQYEQDENTSYTIRDVFNMLVQIPKLGWEYKEIYTVEIHPIVEAYRKLIGLS